MDVQCIKRVWVRPKTSRFMKIIRNVQQVLLKNLLGSGNVQMIHAGIEEHGFVNRPIGAISWKSTIQVSLTGQMNLQRWGLESNYSRQHWTKRIDQNSHRHAGRVIIFWFIIQDERKPHHLKHFSHVSAHECHSVAVHHCHSHRRQQAFPGVHRAGT